MSSTGMTADEWELEVPGDDAELLAELRRHGVRPGRRLRVRIVEEEPAARPGDDFRGSLGGFPEPSWEDFEDAAATA
jgi:hypothetical protein